MTKTVIRIASRNSPLALVQSEWVRQQLQLRHPELTVEIIGMTTEGDRHLSQSLATVGGKGLFVKELEEALLAQHADIAVHSMKDVPVHQPDGLIIPVICQRENPCDAFISNHYSSFADLPIGSTIGTASLRRQCIIKNLRPDLKVTTLRGNLQTRLKKLDDGHYDAIILAVAGLNRMQLTSRICHPFAADIFIPAVGQGALGIECRTGEKNILTFIQALQDDDTTQCVLAERALNQTLEGGCQVPIAAYATIANETLYLRALVGKPDGSVCVRANASGAIKDAIQIGKHAAQLLLIHGADKILKEIYE